MLRKHEKLICALTHIGENDVELAGKIRKHLVSDIAVTDSASAASSAAL